MHGGVKDARMQLGFEGLRGRQANATTWHLDLNGKLMEAVLDLDVEVRQDNIVLTTHHIEVSDTA